MISAIFSPGGIFIMMLVFVWLIYKATGTLAPKATNEGGKIKMYTGGEDLPQKKHNPNAAMFFHIALYFTIIDVAALTIATMTKGASPFLVFFYIGGIVLAIAALLLK